MEELYHVGVLGMHWGIRRYQNPDGTLTELGKERRAKSVRNSSVAGKLSKATRYASAGTGLASVGLAIATGAAVVAGVATGPLGQIGVAAALTAGLLSSSAAATSVTSGAIKKLEDYKVKDLDEWTRH